MEQLCKLVENLVNQHFTQLVKVREHLHMHPELSNQEYQTQHFIINYLQGLPGIEVHKTAETGVVALIEGLKPSSNKHVIALRADIDALAIQDEKECSYRSKVANVMHACGHDVHTTILLGVAIILSEIRDQFSGIVKLFFQPAEETTGGAYRMIQAGWMENPKVEAVIGLHVDPQVPVGMIQYRNGALFATSDMLKITVKGQASHAGYPEEGVDSIVIASEIIMGLQTLVSRKLGFNAQTVLSFGKINGGEVSNALAKEVVLEGTLRTFDPAIRDKALNEIKHIAKNIAIAHYAHVEIEVKSGYPVLINDEAVVDYVKGVASEVLGETNVSEKKTPSAGSEDFAYFAQYTPSCFYLLGVANAAKKINHPLHTPLFDVDPQAIYTGCLLQSMLALSYLIKK